jgi:hypothetical protein
MHIRRVGGKVEQDCRQNVLATIILHSMFWNKILFCIKFRNKIFLVFFGGKES